ncbi:TPA: hypothetical protein ACPUIF_000420, partial [Klebsiella pneumoniae]
MTITETQKTAQLAADAAVSAAEAKQYMLEAEQGYQDTSAAAQQAQDAAGSALLSKQSAATSEENSLQYATEAGVARDEAVTAASNASDYAQNKFTFYKTASDPDGTIAGLAATTDGQSFWVAQGPDALSAAWQYQNKAGVAVLQAKQPGTSAITGTIREFPTLAAAQADADAGNIPVGSTAYYRSSDDSALAVEVINNAGTLQPTGRKMPSQKTVDDLLKHVETTNLIFQLVDILGYRQFYALTSGEFGTAKTIIKPDGIELEGYSLTVSDDNGIYIENILGQRVVLVDEYGNVAPRSLRAARDGSFGTDAAMVSGNGLNFNSGGSRIDITGPEFLKVSDFLGRSKTIIDASGNLVGGGSGGGITLQDRINILNAENLNYYSKVRSRYNADIERLVFALSMIIWYGQSLSTNQEGYPALSKTPYSNLGNLMLGNSPRPNTRTGAGFTPVGSATLNPLKAVVQAGDGSYIMSDAAVAALPAGSGNEGEGA